jgi:hypothetical protein
VPSWLTNILDALPSETAALYFSLAFVGVAWFGVIFIRPIFRLWLRRQKDVNDIVAFASAGFSLFYGLLLGLLSVAAYNNANEISGYVSREAALVGTIYRNVANYPEPTGSELRYLLRDYTLYTIHKDWPAHQQGKILRGGENRLQVIRQGLFDFTPTTPSLQLAHANTVRDFNDMVGLREQRLTGVEASIPGVLWYTVAIGAAINIIFIVLLDARFTFHLLISGLICFFLGLMVFIVYVQDRPLRGENAISPQPFLNVYEVVMQWDDR